MRIQQLRYDNGNFLSDPRNEAFLGTGDELVLVFGAKHILEQDPVLARVKEYFPKASHIWCSTAGEIHDGMVYDNSLSVIAMEFEKTRIKTVGKKIAAFSSSFEAGKALFSELDQLDLAYVLVIADGGLVNGSELVKGIHSVNPKGIPVTGGLAGDGDAFAYTLVGGNEKPALGNMVAVGFYGHHLEVGYGSVGGWDRFGPERHVTRVSGNRLYEIDHKNALEIYKKYLGKYAAELPGSALLFPLAVMAEGSTTEVVRTILSIDHEEGAMVFAGDIPERSRVWFMKANFDKLVGAATQAATDAREIFNSGGRQTPKLAILISCVGRKLILGNRIEEETEAVKDIFGSKVFISGFYSYGEISPVRPFSACQLHNQTMTITLIDEN